MHIERAARAGNGRPLPAGRSRLLVVLASIIVAACAPSVSSTAPHTITGDMTIRDSTTQDRPWVEALGEDCWTSGHFGDIVGSTAVVVRDASDTVIARGKLQSGRTAGTGVCRFAFTVPDVPAADAYTIEVGSRGALPYSRSVLEAEGWQVHMLLDR